MHKNPCTRRQFLSTTALATGGALLGGIRPSKLLFTKPMADPGPYNDNTVVRVYDPLVSSFVFESSDKNFYYRTFDVKRLEAMLGTAILKISGASGIAAAWQCIMPGLTPDSKVAVKININCAHELDGDHGAKWTSAPNTSPCMMAALTRSLEQAGIRQANITFFDCSRTFESQWKEDLHAQCPGIVTLGRGEVAGSGRSIELSDGLPSVQIPAPLMNADYFINLHLLKKHYSGATGALKNLLGFSDNVGPLAHRGGSREFHTGTLLKELSMNVEVRQRAVLCISEAIFGNRLPTENLRPLQRTDAFPGGKPSSLIVSRSPFFQDLVILSFINYEMTGDVNTLCGDGNDTWLRHCVNAVPSFTGDCIGSASLIDSPRGSQLPPKDLSYPPAKVRYISVGPGSID